MSVITFKDLNGDTIAISYDELDLNDVREGAVVIEVDGLPVVFIQRLVNEIIVRHADPMNMPDHIATLRWWLSPVIYERPFPRSLLASNRDWTDIERLIRQAGYGHTLT